MKNIRHYLLLGCAGLFLIALGTSCGIREKTVYFQPTENGSDSIVKRFYSPVYRSNDLLSITVSAMDAEAVKPFNLNVIAFTSDDGRASNAPLQQGYFVDSAGTIDFPVIGKIAIGGLGRSEAVQLIKQKLAPYVVDPLVTIKIMNYKITVLGDVKFPGAFPVPSERVTLPEALGMAGDMNMTGVRKNVLVIRDIDGMKTEIRVDLTSKSAYNSPGYYLQQNDIVYVEPNNAKRNSSIIGTNAGIFISVASLLLTSIALLTR
jgi:polysaccharide biosynthesis/export protein